jgi:hypothetical protein
VVDKIEGTPLKLSYYNSGYNTRNAKYGILEGLSINDDNIMDKFNGPISKVILPVEDKKKNSSLVCGSSGPFAKQNLFGEFRNCGLALPHGMIIDPNNPKELQVTVVNSVIPTNLPEPVKPRLAVVVDYIWHTQSLPLFNFTFGSQLMLWSKEENKDELLCHPKRVTMEALGGFLVEEIKLHAVHGKTGEYFGVAMKLKFDTGKSEAASKTAGRPAAVFDAVVSFETFKMLIAGRGETLDSAIYFVSLHFTAKPLPGGKFFECPPLPFGDGYIDSSYDCKSPYCFPVNFTEISTAAGQTHYRIRKGHKLMSEADDEVPDFEKYKRMPEYRL